VAQQNRAQPPPDMGIQFAWTGQLCLAHEARAWELKRLRYRLLHQSGRIARHARQTILRLARDWPWAGQLAAAFQRLQALPAPTG
jgi:hypothetical protein